MSGGTDGYAHTDATLHGTLQYILDRELMLELDRAAAAELQSGADSARLPAGVRLLDAWLDRSFGAVLFWLDRDLGRFESDRRALHVCDCEFVGGAWRSRGHAGATARSVAEIIAEKGPGLHRLGGSSAGDPVRLTHAIASPEVSTIELRNALRVSERRPGVDGFCLLGITHQDAITYAHALDSSGAPLPTEPILL